MHAQASELTYPCLYKQVQVQANQGSYPNVQQANVESQRAGQMNATEHPGQIDS